MADVSLAAHASKRRRLNHVASAGKLSQPFRSPLKRIEGVESPRPQQQQREEHEQQKRPLLEQQQQTQHRPQGNQERREQQREDEGDKDDYRTSDPETTTKPSQIAHLEGRPISTFKSAIYLEPQTPTPNIVPPHDEATRPSGKIDQRQITALQLRIKQTKADIDILSQAKSLLSNKSGSEGLRDVTNRWKCAAQEVAEEIFPAARERWEGRKRDRVADREEAREEQRERMRDGEGERDRERERGCTDEDGGGGRFDTPRREGRQSACGHVYSDDRENDEEVGFTMELMLKSLGIDPTIIGWHAEEERWVA